MQRKTAADFPPEVLRLFDDYVHGNLTRREFLDRAAHDTTRAFFEQNLKG
jgi:carboxymethylenebutenolidase